MTPYKCIHTTFKMAVLYSKYNFSLTAYEKRIQLNTVCAQSYYLGAQSSPPAEQPKQMSGFYFFFNIRF